MDEILNYRKNEKDNYYNILGCDRLSDIDQIMMEYRARVLKCHPDKTGGMGSMDEFTKLQKAKEVLTCEETRRIYDKWLDSGISLPFERWLSVSRNINPSMHWMKSKHTNPMLSFPSHPKPDSDSEQFVWRQDHTVDDVLKKFRNYEI